MSSSFDLCLPNSKSAAATRGKRPCPLPPTGFRRLLYINSLILKVYMGSFDGFRTPRQVHNSAQLCPIVHNYAQPARAPKTRSPGACPT
jgi:hypothetical protein